MNPLMSCAIPSGFEKKNVKRIIFFASNYQNFFRVIFCTCIFIIRIFSFYAIAIVVFKNNCS